MNSVSKYTNSAKRLKREKTTMSNNSDSDNDTVHVYCRIRPLVDPVELSDSISVLSPDTLAVSCLDSRTIRKEVHYKFRHIFTEHSSQSEVFSTIAYPLLEDLLEGKNGLLFTYGVTGSGKTYTLTGEKNDPGIMPRCIDTIFNSVGEYQAPRCVFKSDKMNGFEVQCENDALHDRLQAARKCPPRSARKGEKLSYNNDGVKILTVNETSLYSVFISYVEIYNNNVYDLLDEGTTMGKTLQNKILREDCRKNMYVNGVIEVEVKSAEEAFDLFNAGQNRKRTAATCLNADSSRSHSIFNIRVVQLEQLSLNNQGQPMIPTENSLKIGQLSLVDLAGSERTNRTNNTGVRLREASSINNSLMTLRTCLEYLRENQLGKGSRLVPYRDSRLTFLFKQYFEGDGTVKMIVCINPSTNDLEENIQVLKFAEMSQDVKISKAEVNRYTPTPLRKLTTTMTSTATPAKLQKASSFTLLPNIPVVKFNLDNMDECRSAIDKVIKALKQRNAKGKQLDKEIEEKQDEMRKKLVNINQQCVLTKAEIKTLKAVVHKEKQKSRNLQTKLGDVEAAKLEVESKHDELIDVIRSLKNTVDEKDLKINHYILDREKTKQKLVHNSQKMTQELDAKLRRQRDHLNAKMKADTQKLRLVKDIIESETPPFSMQAANEAVGDFELKSVASQAIQSTPKHVPPRRNVASVPRPRRSRSAGDVWLEHNVIKPCPLGTVMQPAMKKRKSISKLDKAKDITNPHQSKYCLVAQEPDTEGEMETKLYKADIVPTCGGGAQVIFNDVERLKQESPTKGC